ncbi:alkaline phosphatase D family protein [Halorientalis halophila]|uniref:alkaline phosphatase D family protein n=1 Tax=Halorientalis halophila TaxID=3108499 RepID=UPI003009DA54
MTEERRVDDGRRAALRGIAGAPFALGTADLLGTDAIPEPRSVEPLSGGASRYWGDRDTDGVFPQSVASGDPTPTGAVVWTRVNPDAFDPNAPLELVVATDEDFERDRRTFAVGTDDLAAHDYTAKIDLDGRLSPDERYYYRFVYDDVASETGEFRTLPAPGSSPERVRFGIVNCQDYRNGYYGAFAHLAREDLDFVLHLGDFVYEYGGFTESQAFYEYFDRYVRLPSGESVAVDLADFRHLYRTYRGDRFLQAALERHALVPTWDDHEIVDNRYWDYEEDRPRAGAKTHPCKGDPDAMRRLFAAGIRAWWEYMPVRVGYDPNAADLQQRLRLYRTFEFGDLLDLVVTDERLYRTSPEAGDKLGIEFGSDDSGSVAEADIDQTMLGETQRRWFLKQMRDGDATWSAWANEVLLTDFRVDTDYATVFNADAWDGFATERRYLLDRLRDGPENLLVFSGDLHSSLAGYVARGDAASPDSRVGVELMTPAVTSPNLRERLDGVDSARVERYLTDAIVSRSAQVEALDSGHWGYAVAEVTRDACEFTVHAVDKSVNSGAAPKEELFSYRVPAGEVDLRRV